LLELKGCIVTLDARDCQTEIAEKIIEKGADYVLAVKGNQGQLYEAIVDFFETAQKAHFQDVPFDYHGKRRVGMDALRCGGTDHTGADHLASFLGVSRSQDHWHGGSRTTPRE
jgi:hypothetical protein